MNTTDSQTKLARRRAGSAARRGFTLIEVLLVIVIIGMLATVLIFTVGGRTDAARVDTTKLTIQKISQRIEEFNSRTGAYPPDLDALVTKPADEKLAKNWYQMAQPAELNDAWGNKLEYELMETGTQAETGLRYKLSSKGADGQAGTEDDVLSSAAESNKAGT